MLKMSHPQPQDSIRTSYSAASSPFQLAIPQKVLMENAKEVAKLLKVIGQHERFMLLCAMSHGEVCVGDLEKALYITQPILSQQLAKLRAMDLVKTRRSGKKIYYRLNRAPNDQKQESTVNILDTLLKCYYS